MTQELALGKKNRFYDLAPQGWKTPTGIQYCSFMSSIFTEVLFDSNILMIGTGWGDEQYFTWPDLLIQCGAKNVDYLEVSDIYIEKWKNNKYKVIKGDVRNVQDYVIDKYDCLFWFHGPEHIKAEEVELTFTNLLQVCPVIIAACPFGSYYDYQFDLNGNIYEEHVQKNLTKESFLHLEKLGYNIIEFGTKDAPDAQVVIWK